MSSPLDPRINAYRPDLAAASLSHLVKAERYVEGAMRQNLRGVVPLLKEPKAGAEQISQIRYGEFIDVLEEREDGFFWVQNRNDRYVGYMAGPHLLGETIAPFSNRISVLRSFVYENPTVKKQPVDELTLGSYVTVTGEENGYARLIDGRYVWARHVASTEESLTPDYVFTAGRLLGVPYLWGGCTPKGIDCSGLVQLALDMAGIDCPRDSDMQREAFAKPLLRHWRDTPWQRGDLVFFAGHVGIMAGPTHIIHASGHHMQVVSEPLVTAVEVRGIEVEAAGRPV